VAADERCEPAIDVCCAGSFCESGPYVPEEGRCRPKRADGEFCGFSFECTNGLCNSSGRCGAESCAAVGENCFNQACCAGSFCERNAYVTNHGRCTLLLLANGDSCLNHDECQVGVCSTGVCGIPVCAPAGAECFGFDAPCCDGLVCDMPADSYGPGVCGAKLPDAAPCETDIQCASESCIHNRCQELGPVGSVSFARIFDEVLVPNGCTGGYCHGGGAGGLWMSSEEVAHRNLTAVRAAGAGCGGVPRVQPGEVESSLLWAKVAPGVPAPCGNKMPPSRGGLSAGSLQLIEAWIRAGAPR
jgi:hypothetical protein